MIASLTLGITALITLTPIEQSEAHNGLWPGDTALTLPPGRMEFGLFSPSRIPITEHVELQSNLLLNIAVPNLGAQVHWTTQGSWVFSTRHTLRYPTLFLGYVSGSGTGGLLPANSTPPQLLEIENEVLISQKLSNNQVFTFSAGVHVTPQLAKGVQPSGSVPVINFPFLYPRLGTIQGGVAGRAGVALSGFLTDYFDYAIDLDITSVPAVDGGFALEQGLEIAWRMSKNASLAGGWRMSYANYAYGTQAHIMPVLDFRVAVD